MAEIIIAGWELEIREAANGRYNQKVFIHTASGCEFTEEEYKKRTRENRK